MVNWPPSLTPRTFFTPSNRVSELDSLLNPHCWGVTEMLRHRLDEGETVALILLDLSAAFDTVSHHNLVRALQSLGLDGMALEWLCSFLKDLTF